MAKKVLLHKNLIAVFEGNIRGGSGGQIDKKKKPLIYKGFQVWSIAGSNR